MTIHENDPKNLEQPIKPTDNVQTTHTMDKLADGGPLEQPSRRPDLVELTEEEVEHLPRNVTRNPPE